jgi:hypothetical protein
MGTHSGMLTGIVLCRTGSMTYQGCITPGPGDRPTKSRIRTRSFQFGPPVSEFIAFAFPARFAAHRGDQMTRDFLEILFPGSLGVGWWGGGWPTRARPVLRFIGPSLGYQNVQEFVAVWVRTRPGVVRFFLCQGGWCCLGPQGQTHSASTGLPELVVCCVPCSACEVAFSMAGRYRGPLEILLKGQTS